MVRDWKVLSFVMNRGQVLYKMVSEPPLSLTDVEEATSGATDAVDHIDRYTGERLSNVKGLFGALNGGEGGDIGAGGLVGKLADDSKLGGIVDSEEGYGTPKPECIGL
eukprot:g24640.t1